MIWHFAGTMAAVPPQALTTQRHLWAFLSRFSLSKYGVERLWRLCHHRQSAAAAAVARNSRPHTAWPPACSAMAWPPTPQGMSHFATPSHLSAWRWMLRFR
jgi:hypothetical protein